MNFIKQYTMALSTLAFLFLFDFFCTKQIVSILGFDAEANPIAYYLLITFQTIWVLLAFKVIVMWILCGVALLVYVGENVRTKNLFIQILWGLVIVTLLVDLWSIHVLKVIS